MYTLDIIVLGVLGTTMVFGFIRGLIEEILSLGAWAAASAIIFYFHSAVVEKINPFILSQTGSAIVAFFVLLVLPYALIRLIAKRLGKASRSSIIGPIDRILGLGFGALKGSLFITFAFSVFVIIYDNVWSYQERPNWVIDAKTYPFIDATSTNLVELIALNRDGNLPKLDFD